MARTSIVVDNHALYEAALEGLELQRQRLEEQIRQVRAVLGNRRMSKVETTGSSVESAAAAPRKRRKRNLSPEARERIALAQKKRWEAFRATKG